MRHIIISLTALCILISTVNCTGQNRDKIMQADLESAFDQNTTDSTLVTGWYYILDNENGFKRQLDKTEEFYFVDPKPILLKKHFDKVEIYETDDFKVQANYQYALSIQIHRNYEDYWADATEKSSGKRVGLIIDNKLVNAPMVKSRIEGGISTLNRGVYDKGELDNFIILIEEQ